MVHFNISKQCRVLNIINVDALESLAVYIFSVII